MGIFGDKKKKNDFVAVIDIGSGSVGMAFVKFSKDKNGLQIPSILAQARTAMKYQNELDFEKFSFYMHKALNETVEKLLKLHMGRPKKIYCFLASPWYISETRTIYKKEDKKFITSKKNIDELIKTELRDVINDYQKKYTNKDDKPKLLESVVLESLINGYKVNDLYNKKASSLNIIMYLSVSPESVIRGIENNLKNFYPHSDINFGSFMMSFYNAIRMKYPQSQSHLLIDISAEITDVGMVSDGILTSFFSFPIGRNYILRTIMKKQKCTIEEAQSIFGLYANNEIETKRKKEIDFILADVEKSWKNIFYKTIVELSKLTGYTDEVYLVSHRDSSLYFSSILQNPNVPLGILGDRKFSVSRLTGNDLKSLCKVESGTCDEFLMAHALCGAYVYTV